MPKAVHDVDWYVDMSERMERRERRRKWVALALCVGLPLLIMGGFVLYIVLDRAGVFERLRGAVREIVPDGPAKVKSASFGPVSTPSLQQGDIQFAQLDGEGMVTSVTHFFREQKPEGAAVFTVNRETETEGTLIAYRLMNLGTTISYDFADVKVKKIGGEWTITEEGWQQIRDELRAKMNVRLGRPTS